MSRNLFFSALLTFFMCFNEAKSYYPYPGNYNSNPFLEYAFTMMYFETAMTPCGEVIAKPKEALVAVIRSALSTMPVPLDGFNEEDIIAKLDAVYEYCRANPNETFGKAIITSLNIDTSNFITRPGASSSNANPSTSNQDNNPSSNQNSNPSGNRANLSKKQQKDSVQFIN